MKILIKETRKSRASPKGTRKSRVSPVADEERKPPRDDVVARWPATLTILVAIPTAQYWLLVSTGSPLRYLIILSVCAIAIAIDGKHRSQDHRSFSAVELGAIIYGLYIVGIFCVSSISSNKQFNTTILVIGAVILVIGPLARRVLPIASESSNNKKDKTNKLVALTCSVFGTVGVLDVLRAPQGEPPSFFNHETLFVAVLVLCLPYRGAFLFAKLSVAIALILSFIHYPTATAALALGVAAGLYIALRNHSVRKRIGLIAAVVIVLIPLSQLGVTVLQTFYATVGRVDNSSTRDLLWQQAIRALSQEPILGTLGQSNITGLAIIRGILQPIPFHNSYLTLAVYGGLLAAGLLTILMAGRLHHALVSPHPESTYNLVWAPPLATAAIAMLVNPVLDNAASAVPFYLLLLLSMYKGPTSVHPR